MGFPTIAMVGGEMMLRGNMAVAYIDACPGCMTSRDTANTSAVVAMTAALGGCHQSARQSINQTEDISIFTAIVANKE
jgi:Fe-S cluster biogenesis protein NfuA